MEIVATDEVVWTNIKRYMTLRHISDAMIADALGQSSYNFRKNREKGANIGVKSIGPIAHVFDIQPLDLFEIWSDEEWESFMKQME